MQLFNSNISSSFFVGGRIVIMIVQMQVVLLFDFYSNDNKSIG